ncbi:hypothetical protein J2T02_005699 [Chitinophaga terrae (ex Kim and Jung 2007)]|nr:hypothetical protein [Chitinophaga terrae (ex Kim and Jung 2007)]
MVIQFKAFFLTRMMTRLFVVSGILVCLFFLLSDLHMSYKYFLSMVAVFCGMLYMFYLNRNELSLMKTEEGEVKFSFVNNSFFRRKDVTLPKKEIRCVQEAKMIKLFIGEKLFAIIRQESVEAEE